MHLCTFARQGDFAFAVCWWKAVLTQGKFTHTKTPGLRVDLLVKRRQCLPSIHTCSGSQGSQGSEEAYDSCHGAKTSWNSGQVAGSLQGHVLASVILCLSCGRGFLLTSRLNLQIWIKYELNLAFCLIYIMSLVFVFQCGTVLGTSMLFLCATCEYAAMDGS